MATETPCYVFGVWQGIIDRKTGKDGKHTYLTGLLETDSKYNNTIPMAMVGVAGDVAQHILAGSQVRVEVKIGGREWNGKYYAEIWCVEIGMVCGQSAPPPQREPPRPQAPKPQPPPSEPALPTTDNIPF